MTKMLVLYGSYRADRTGISLVHYLTRALTHRGAHAELIDAQQIGLPMLDRMYKEYPKGQAPEKMETLAAKIRAAKIRCCADERSRAI
jgi:NAD(P)H-dependent FMN reductase